MDKEQNPMYRLMELAAPYRHKYILSVVLAILGVAAGLVPFFAVSKIILLLMGGETAIYIYLSWCLIAGAGFLAKVCFFNLSTFISHTAAFETLCEIRIQLVDKLTKVPMGYIINTPSGQLKNILVDRVEGMETTLAHLIPELTANFCIPVCIIIYLLFLDWRMALASMVTLPVGMLCYKGMVNGYEEKFQGLMMRVRKMTNTVVEYIGGIEVIKAFNQSANSYHKYADAVEDNALYAVNWIKSVQVYKSMLFTVWPSVLVSVLPVGCVLYRNGSLSVPVFVTCIVLSLGIITPILNAMNFTDSIAQMKSIVGEICSVLDEKELARPVRPVKLDTSSISMENVSFSYEENKSLLEQVSLNIPEKTITAFVGPSGGGKSTITKLIAGFWDVTAGAVKIDGINIREIPLEQLMDQVAYISQDNYLFDETVIENIRMGKPAATDEEVYQAAKDCGCYDFILKLENGFQTVVGGAGGHLSGGERQRIAIARAVLKNAPIVILDEATAYIDAENEALIQEAMAKIIDGKTVLMIAHRLSTITDADKIVVVKNGHIEAEGTHQNLLLTCPLYQEMWKAHIDTKDVA
ncbi:ABC transporter ATP-binding protein [Sinanaerobacter sp. ZZT-01]|uniref:ABC transporter ATP-binding protein n=1 Tax=Sinanaerobacter sp. ZZT-01 TaxID=3111540 RepID=UPI002D77D34A|nr:ABC transporter ATP-binding protein [Sinanaerobacter sp. ZZT-01]WRR93765.1 ABC transporter ATP-binding protein [Sinanaerobacter sp. ZZT-01]